MMASSGADAVSRRREQNRMAQRRFRWKQSETKIQAKRPPNFPLHGEAHCSPSLPEPPLSPQTPGPGSSGGNDENLTAPTSAPISTPAATRPARLPCVYSVLQKYTLLDFGRVDYKPLPEQETKSRKPDPPSACAPAPMEYVDVYSPATEGKTNSATTRSGTGAESSQPAVRHGPLHIAAQKGHDRIVRTLLQYHSDCNERDGDGMTPLMHAAAGGHREVVSTLVAHGARVDEVDARGRSAVHWAVACAHETVLRLLLEQCRRTDVIDRRDGAGQTALHLAVENGFEAGVCALLELGADPNPKG